MVDMPSYPESLICDLCGQRAEDMIGHLRNVHNIEPGDYVGRSLKAPAPSRVVDSEATNDSRGKTRTICGFEFPVFPGVPKEACFPRPEHYHWPTKGKLRETVEDILVSLSFGRSIYVWGLPGLGKDALFHAWSAMTRTPAEVFVMRPDANIQEWFYVRGFDDKGTVWEEGRLLQICRDGYKTRKGKRVPYLVLISDFDRAGRVQAEGVRLLTDSIQGRLKGPGGTTYPVLKGTVFAFTANTSGAGDSRGRCISAQPIDASILSRIERKYHFPWMSWEDEAEILRRKFRALCHERPGILDLLKSCRRAIQDSIEAEEFYGEFGHRELCAWLGHAQDLLGRVPNMDTEILLPRASRCWIDGLPDDEARLTAKRLIDPFIGILRYEASGRSAVRAASHLFSVAAKT